MNIKIDKHVLVAALVAIVVGAVLISNGIRVELNIDGESVLQAIGFVGSVVGVFVIVLSRTKKKGDESDAD